jgi:hypothetical protein
MPKNCAYDDRTPRFAGAPFQTQVEGCFASRRAMAPTRPVANLISDTINNYEGLKRRRSQAAEAPRRQGGIRRRFEGIGRV